jgi:hypothetical protein
VMIGSLHFISFFFGLDLFVVDYFDKLCVWQCSMLEVWRGIFDCKAKMDIVGLVCCWWSSVEVKLYEETSAIEEEAKFLKKIVPMLIFSRVRSCWIVE